MFIAAAAGGSNHTDHRPPKTWSWREQPLPPKSIEIFHVFHLDSVVKRSQVQLWRERNPPTRSEFTKS